MKPAHLTAVILSLLLAAARSPGSTTLTGIFETDGSVVWSGRLTYTLNRDSRVVVNLGAGSYGVDNNVYYRSDYGIQEDFDPNTDPRLDLHLNPAPIITTPPGIVPLWDGDNGWDYSWVFGGVAFSDSNVYQDPVLPVVPQSFSLPHDQLSLPANLSFTPEFSGAAYADPAGNRVVFQITPATGYPVPEGGSSVILLGGAMLCLLGPGVWPRRARRARRGA